MVNKRFNRKFRRALEAALGALSVASISNIDTITKAYTETDIENNALINWIFQMPRDNLNRLWNYTKECKNNEIKLVPASGILDKGNVGAFMGDVKVSYPYYLGKIGDWEGYNVTVHIAAHIPIRISILQATDIGGHPLYLGAPPLTPSMFRNYASTHNLPLPYSWTKKNGGPATQSLVRPPVPPLGFDNAQAIRYQTSPPNMNHGDFPEQQANQAKNAHGQPHPSYAINRNRYVSPINFVPKFRKYFQARWDPAGPRPALTGADPNGINRHDALYLTRWHADLLTDAYLWDEALARLGGPDKMLMHIDVVPDELRDFYYPPEKKEEPNNISYSNSSPAQLTNPSPMNMAPVLTALAPLTAVTMATPQPTAPYSGVSPHNVTPGSNNVGNASSSQSGSDVKPTSVQHDAKSEAHSNEPLKT